jgi:hypothetical protein
MVCKDLVKMQRSRLQILLVVMTLSTVLLSSTMILHGNQQEVIAQKQAQRSSPLSDIVTIQNTSMSIAAPNAPVNKQSVPHQIVVALPLRQDGKIWTGTVTFTASKNIEIEVEHKYNPSDSRCQT